MMPEDWEPTEECRIGSLPWFAGVFWLILACLLSSFGRLALKLRLHRLSWAFIMASNRACQTASRCAFEGGAKL